MREVDAQSMAAPDEGTVAAASSSAGTTASPLKDAIAANALQGDGKLPFHLKMSFQIMDLEGKPEEPGTLEEWWAGPDGFAFTIAAPSFGTVHNVRLDDLSDDTARRSLYLAEVLLNAVRAPSIHLGGPDATLVSEQEKIGPVTLDCMHYRIKKTPVDQEPATLCLDRPDGTIRTVRVQGSVITRNRTGTFGGTPVALTVSVALAGRLAIEGQVDELKSFDPAHSLVNLQKPQPKGQSTSTLSAVRLPAAAVAGALTRQIQPTYPPQALRELRAGTVLLHAQISDTGTVAHVFPIASPDPLMTAAAMDAVKKWVYRPYLLNGNPTEVDTTITVNFNINRSGNRF